MVQENKHHQNDNKADDLADRKYFNASHYNDNTAQHEISSHNDDKSGNFAFNWIIIFGNQYDFYFNLNSIELND